MATRRLQIDAAKALAEHIANRLFTNGAGRRAQRLVLEIGEGQTAANLGGWGYQPAVDQIADVLRHFVTEERP